MLGAVGKAAPKPLPSTPSGPIPAPVQVTPLQSKLVAIDDVRPDQQNAREHNERNLSSIAESLKKFGQQKPIVVDKDGVIRAGNGTWLGAKRLGWKSINIIQTELTAAEAKLYALADNRLNELSYFDDAVLAEQLRDVAGEDLTALGFDSAELAEIFESQQELGGEGTGSAKGRQGALGQVSVRLLVAVSNVELVERALALTGEMNREQALLKICQAFCDAKGQFDTA